MGSQKYMLYNRNLSPVFQIWAALSQLQGPQPVDVGLMREKDKRRTGEG